jgi:hypothetical protein
MIALAFGALTLATQPALADELLGGKKGGGSGGGSAPPKGSPPPKGAPPVSNPPQGAPPKSNPPQGAPPRTGNQGAPPPRTGGQEGAPPRTGNQGAPPARGQDGFLQGAQRRGDSRSGQVSYGSVNNQPVERTQPIYGGAPTMDNSRIARDARLEDRIRQVEHYRQGYTHYSSQWRDDYFWYPHYQFGYNPSQCVPSPWYYYPHLPAYVSRNRVQIVVNINPIWRSARNDYSYRRPSGPYDQRATSLDWAITDIEDAFEAGTMRYFGRMIPTRGRVEVDLGREWRYQMSSDDFYDLLSDMVQGTDTIKYVYLGTRFNGREAIVFYAHRYRDPWGRQAEAFHTFGLEQRGRDWQITYFQSSQDDARRHGYDDRYDDRYDGRYDDRYDGRGNGGRRGG